jgi:hypothetical protein
MGKTYFFADRVVELGDKIQSSEDRNDPRDIKRLTERDFENEVNRNTSSAATLTPDGIRKLKATWARVAAVDLKSNIQPKKVEVPNKMAQADPRWSNKVAWNSDALFERQLTLETYSVEVAMIIEAVRVVAERAGGRSVTNDELAFVANFGSPIESNRQRVSIGLTEPFNLQIMLIRELVDGRLKFTAETTYSENTPFVVANRLTDVRKASGEIPLDYMLTSDGVAGPQAAERLERRRRKVKL